MLQPVHYKTKVYDILQTVLLAKLVAIQLFAVSSVTDLPTKAQVDEIIKALSDPLTGRVPLILPI